MKSLLLKSLVTLAFLTATSAAYAGMCEGLKPEGTGTVASNLVGETMEVEYFLNSPDITGEIGNSLVDEFTSIVSATDIENSTLLSKDWDLDANNVLTTSKEGVDETLSTGDMVTIFVRFPGLTNKTITGASFGPNHELNPANIEIIDGSEVVITVTAPDSSSTQLQDNIEVNLTVVEEGGATQEEIEAYTGCLDHKIDRLQTKIDRRNNYRLPKLQAKKAHLEAKKASLDPSHCNNERRIKVLNKIISRVMARITKVQNKVAELEAKKAALQAERDNY